MRLFVGGAAEENRGRSEAPSQHERSTIIDSWNSIVAANVNVGFLDTIMPVESPPAKVLEYVLLLCLLMHVLWHGYHTLDNDANYELASAEATIWRRLS